VWCKAFSRSDAPEAVEVYIGGLTSQGRVPDLASGRRATLGVMVLVFPASLFVEFYVGGLTPYWQANALGMYSYVTLPYLTYPMTSMFFLLHQSPRNLSPQELCIFVVKSNYCHAKYKTQHIY